MTVIITFMVAAAATIIGGLILKIIEQKIFKHDDSSNTVTVHVPQNNTPSKILTDQIIDKICPERNYEKVKEILGIPDKVVKDSSAF